LLGIVSMKANLLENLAKFIPGTMMVNMLGSMKNEVGRAE